MIQSNRCAVRVYHVYRVYRVLHVHANIRCTHTKRRTHVRPGAMEVSGSGLLEPAGGPWGTPGDSCLAGPKPLPRAPSASAAQRASDPSGRREAGLGVLGLRALRGRFDV